MPKPNLPRTSLISTTASTRPFPEATRVLPTPPTTTLSNTKSRPRARPPPSRLPRLYLPSLRVGPRSSTVATSTATRARRRPPPPPSLSPPSTPLLPPLAFRLPRPAQYLPAPASLGPSRSVALHPPRPLLRLALPASRLIPLSLVTQHRSEPLARLKSLLLWPSRAVQTLCTLKRPLLLPHSRRRDHRNRGIFHDLICGHPHRRCQELRTP